MKIIAQTDNNYLITATREEIQDTLKAVNGNTSDDIHINQQIPLIDFATLITKIKELKYDSDWDAVCSKLETFYSTMVDLQAAIERADNIDKWR